ncbi:hypothetical protein M758_12G076400 [Ceratodon purpureus]|nr:hypothetical protein M758_12G076400 [Ceratodon purpureus]
MWKSLVPARCPRLWQEYACRRKFSRGISVTVLFRNGSSFRLLEAGAFDGVRVVSDGLERVQAHGEPSWLRRDAIGGRRGGVRAVVAEEEEVGWEGLDRHVVAELVGSGEGRGWKSGGVADRGSLDEVVKMLPAEDLYENLSRMGGKSEVDGEWVMSGMSGFRVEKLGGDDEAMVDVRRVAMYDSEAQNGASKRDVSKLQSEDVTGGRQWNPLAGPAEYRRRRTAFDRIRFGGDGPHRHSSLREFSHRAASETYLITRLAFTLLKFLGIGTRWIGKFLRLGLYAVFLMPGFIQVGYFYYFDKRIYRSIIYGDQPRNRFDLYLPPDSDKPKPVVIFITGGAWVIGYKAWGSLLAQQLVERDVIVACIDYRNFPQGSISDMIADVSRGIGYVYKNIESYGGDPNMVYLAGQSAGAHLAACALLMQAEKEISEDAAELVWRSSKLKSYMAISGGYNLVKLVEYFHTRGLDKSIMLRVMEGEKSLPIYSPEYMVQIPTFKKAVPLLPPITLFHGTGDYSIPHEASEAFADALRSVGAQVNTVLYPDKTHTDLFLQDPMRGGKDELLADILAVVHANDEEARAEDVKNAYFRRRLVPEILLQLARRVSPF